MAKHKKYRIVYSEPRKPRGANYKAGIILGLSKSDAIIQLVNRTDVLSIVSVERIK